MEDPYCYPGTGLLKNRLEITPETVDAKSTFAIEEAFRSGNERCSASCRETPAGISPRVSAGNGLFTLIGFMGLYMVLGMLFLFMMGREIEHGPEAA